MPEVSKIAVEKVAMPPTAEMLAPEAKVPGPVAAVKVMVSLYPVLVVTRLPYWSST